MLPCQYLGGRHDAGLITVVKRDQCCHECDYRLATAHISLQQTVHLLAAAHVMAHLADDPLLGTREWELQHIIIKVMEISPDTTEHMTHQATAATLDVMQDIEFKEEEFLKLQSQLRSLQ